MLTVMSIKIIIKKIIIDSVLTVMSIKIIKKDYYKQHAHCYQYTVRRRYFPSQHCQGHKTIHYFFPLNINQLFKKMVLSLLYLMHYLQEE